MATRELTREEAEALTKDMQAVLVKHNCEMGVIASIQLLKRLDEEVVSPIQPNDLGTEPTTDNTPPTSA